MGFFSFIGSLIYYLIKTPICLVWWIVTLIFHPVTFLVALITLYIYYTSGAEKSDIPFISKLAPVSKPPAVTSAAKNRGKK